MIDIEQFKILSDVEKNRILEDILFEVLTKELPKETEDRFIDILDCCAPYQVTSFMVAILTASGISYCHLVWDSKKIICGKIATQTGVCTQNIFKILGDFDKAIEAEDNKERTNKMINSLLIPLFDNILPRLKEHNQAQAR